jgi:hypothetical protein
VSIVNTENVTREQILEDGKKALGPTLRNTVHVIAASSTRDLDSEQWQVKTRCNPGKSKEVSDPFGGHQLVTPPCP